MKSSLVFFLCVVLLSKSGHCVYYIDDAILLPDTPYSGTHGLIAAFQYAQGSIGKPTFSKFNDVVSLQIWYSSLDNIDFEAFAEVPNLEILEFRLDSVLSPVTISGENLKSIANLKKLQIDSDDAQSISIESGALVGNTNLEELQLKNYRPVDSLTLSKELKGLTNLNTLILDECSINEIAKDAFSDLGELEKLFITESGVTNLEVGSFDSLQKLRFLELSRNNLTSWDCAMFEALGKAPLEYIGLYGNKIAGGGNASFCGKYLPNLISLDLSSNQIDSADWSSLEGMNSLSLINLANNKLGIDELFKFVKQIIDHKLPSLTKIDISFNAANCREVELLFDDLSPWYGDALHVINC